jgi:hypothetical protein
MKHAKHITASLFTRPTVAVQAVVMPKLTHLQTFSKPELLLSSSHYLPFNFQWKAEKTTFCSTAIA